MANFLNGHSSETRPVKKKKKIRYSRFHIVTHLWQFMGQNSKIWGSKKFDKDFEKRNLWTQSPARCPQGVAAPPKMIPPYSLSTCPPTTPKTLWCPVTPSLRKHWLSEDPWFWPKYSNGPGVAKNWHMSKLTKRGPRRCLKLSWDQIWQKMSMGSVPNCRKEIANRYGIRWFKCKLKPPKKSNTWTMEEVHKKK